MRHWILFLALALFGAGIDLATKSRVLSRVVEGEEVEVIPGYLTFGHVYNEGIVFGKFNEAKTVWLVVSIVAVPLIVAIFAAVKNPKWVLTVTLGLILAGTLGNLYDRAAFGKVRDFIKFSYDARHAWPLFNVADACICVGVLLLSVEMIFFDEKKKSKWKEAARAHEPAAPQPETAPAPFDERGPVDGDRPASSG